MAEKTPAPRKKPENPTSIVRIAGKDINGALNIERGLQSIKGIGANTAKIFANAIESKLGIDKNTTIGSLSDTQIDNIEAVLKAPSQLNMPAFLYNRRKNSENGQDMHIIGNDLLFAVRQDINKQITIKTWRGFRHQYGLKVRGQSTRSTGRSGTTVGVLKKAIKAQQQPAAKGGAAPAKK
ncbi:MAG: 30S ribosomal protein S13 [Candidatus Marsarchaeota archaeon]|nr:30S ribosomal protein S13 [Candidatus Marsarchaeota archaeon]MCL5106386.1 30S ribosomal protein S13 [Candidatus Marsarchaeota archaeon]